MKTIVGWEPGPAWTYISKSTLEGGNMPTQLLRVGEAAKRLNVSRWTIYRWVEEDRLKATKIGKGSLRIFQ